MNIVIDAIAAIAGEKLRAQFPDGESEKGWARLEGFYEEELTAIANDLHFWAREQKIPLVVISSQHWKGLPDYCKVETGAVAYRNNDSCIYLVAEGFSDAQSLKNVCLLSDGNLLGLDEADIDSGLHAIDVVWQILRQEDETAPQSLRDAIKDLLECLVEGNRPLALREWIQFAVQVCQRANEAPFVDPRVAREAMSKGLHKLKLFPDIVLRDIDGLVPRKRRISKNLQVSTASIGPESDGLVSAVEKTQFRDLGEQPLEGAELEAVRKRLISFLQATGRSTKEGLEFSYWLQLMQRTATRKGVGTRIYDLLEAEHINRLQEYVDLGVKAGLDTRDQESAQEFLDAEPQSEAEKPLRELLTKSLRNAVEKIANPSSPSVEHPLRHLLSSLYSILEEDAEVNGKLILEVNPKHGDRAKDKWSKALFALLFGQTLKRAQERTALRDWSFEVDPTLLDPSPLGSWIQEDEKDEYESIAESGGGEKQWQSLRLRLRWSDDEVGLSTFEWRPLDQSGFIVFARILLCPETWSWNTPGASFDQWCEISSEPGNGVGTSDLETANPLVQEWLVARENFLAESAKTGLDAEQIKRYVEHWLPILEKFRKDYVPDGSSYKDVGQFLSVDVHRGDTGSPTMLSTHPLRLRWVARHLEEMCDSLVEVFHKKLSLNSVNDRLFFTALGKVSPHEQPPLICDDSKIYVAVRESCWHEHYDVVRTRDNTLTDWLSDLDDLSLNELSNAVGVYIDSYPHKADGLHLLIVAREGSARAVRTIVRQILKQTGPAGKRSEMRTTIHVVCPREDFGPISDSLDEFDRPEDRAAIDFPRMRVVFHEWVSGNQMPDLATFDNHSIDVAIVPNLFSARTRCQESTRSSSTRMGVFDSWNDRPTRRESGGADKSVSRELIPERADQPLEQWSTVNVRHFRSNTVGAEEDCGDEIDFVELSVSVAEGEDFFSKVHEVAHWVVTLDAFVGRKQIEALDNQPDVINVKPGLGKNGTYTLVISSKSGQEFVIARLTRRLKDQLGQALPMPSEKVAEAIYDNARELAPGTILRALGLGRTAQEIVGLVACRRLVQQFDPKSCGGGESWFESWISLDEQSHWFREKKSSRADLLRVFGAIKDDKLALSLTIVEAKLRSHSAVRKAEEQVSSTLDLCREAFRSKGEDESRDTTFWRPQLVDAIQDSSRYSNSGKGTTFRAVWGGHGATNLPEKVSEVIRNGDYFLDDMNGVVCTMGEGEVGDDTVSPNDGHRWIRCSLSELADVLSGIISDSKNFQVQVENIQEESPSQQVVDSVIGTEGTKEPHGGSVVGSAAEKPVGGNRGLSTKELNARYQLVLDTFSQYGVEVLQVPKNPAEEGPGFFVFRVKPGAGVNIQKIQSKKQELQLALELPESCVPRSFIDRGSIVFEIPKDEHERYWVYSDQLWSGIQWPNDRLWIPIGEDVRGEPVIVDFSSNETPHLLIGGMTGSGKSEALKTILVGLVEHYSEAQLRLIIVDPKRTEFFAFKNSPYLEGDMGYLPEDAISVLANATLEMEKRYKLFEKNKVNNIRHYNAAVGRKEKMPFLLVVLDEYAELTSDSDNRRQVETHLARLSQMARAVGIHVIVATQKPSAQIINTTVRSNLGAQLAFRVKTNSDSRIIMDEGGAETLAGSGDAFLRTSGTNIVRLQCALVRDD